MLRGALMRWGVAAVLLALSVVGLSRADDAKATISQSVRITAQPLGAALAQFAQTRHLQIIYHSEVVGARRTAGAIGQFTPEQELEQLLRGTGLTYRYLNETTVTILPVALGGGAVQTTGAAARGSKPPQSSPERKRKGESDSSSRSRSSATAADPAGPEDAPSDSDGIQGISGERLKEVIVTAEKRKERLQDVPVPVTVVDTGALTEQNQLKIQDYYASVPGLQYAPSAYSTQGLSIRGITTTSYGNPVVGVAIDGVPFGSSTQWGSGETLPDFDPGDLARIEVLRGPQGTLFGVDSIGGLINFVTAEPSTEHTFGRVQAGVNSVYNGDRPGYDARGFVNVPLGTSAAIRASGFTRTDPGYIDNPLYRFNGVNRADTYGGMVSILGKISNSMTVKLVALDQRESGGGSSEVDLLPGLATLQQNYLPGVGRYLSEAQAYIATLDAKFGDVKLTALSGYNVNTEDSSTDFTFFLGSITQSVYGVMGSPIVFDLGNKKYSQEIRLSGPLGRSFDWLVGGFGTHERGSYLQHFLAQDPVTGNVIANNEIFFGDSTYDEYAGFADLTLHVNDKFDIQAGGRGGHINQSFSQLYDGPETPAFTGATTQLVVTPTERASANAFTYLLTPRLKVSPDLMVYMRFTSGYQAGGPNVVLPDVPSQYNPDTTWDYEFGIKGLTQNHRLSYDASLYYIDWRSIQLTLNTPAGTSYVANGARAKSEGLEVSLKARPADGLTVSGWLSWDNAELTQNLPPASVAAGIYGAAGDRLPYSARISSYLSLEQRFALTPRATAFVTGAVSYLGGRRGEFTYSAASRERYPAYAKVDFTAGLDYDFWAITAFVNNVTNSHAELTGGAGAALPFAYYILKPREIGLNVARDF
jgi:iron complex outermembrane recepter protein